MSFPPLLPVMPHKVVGTEPLFFTIGDPASTSRRYCQSLRKPLSNSINHPSLGSIAGNHVVKVPSLSLSLLFSKIRFSFHIGGTARGRLSPHQVTRQMKRQFRQMEMKVLGDYTQLRIRLNRNSFARPIAHIQETRSGNSSARTRNHSGPTGVDTFPSVSSLFFRCCCCCFETLSDSAIEKPHR